MKKPIKDLSASDFMGRWHSDHPLYLEISFYLTANLKGVLVVQPKKNYKGEILVKYNKKIPLHYEGAVSVKYVDELKEYHLELRIGESCFLIEQIDDDEFYLTSPSFEDKFHLVRNKL